MLRPMKFPGEEAPEPIISAHKRKCYSTTLELTMGDETFEMVAVRRPERWTLGRTDFVVNRLETSSGVATVGKGSEGERTTVINTAKKPWRNQFAIAYSDATAAVDQDQGGRLYL